MIDKDLQDLAWRCLPREFKEEVKIYYQYAYVQYGKSDLYRGSANAIESLFGHHNLTSDAEGEVDEMLYVSRKQVQEMYDALQSEQERKDLELYNQVSAEDRAAMLFDLFGSKCLLDNVANEVNFASKESKFRKGDKFRYKKNPGEVYTVDHITNDGKVYYWDKDADGVSKAYFVNPDYIEPYTEPKEKLGMDARGWFRIDTDAIGNKIKVRIPSGVTEPYTEPSKGESAAIHAKFVEESLLANEESHLRNLSQNIENLDKHFDNILKDNFSKERRLNIAAMIAAGWFAHDGPKNMDPDIMAADSLTIADALIAEAEKGGSK